MNAWFLDSELSTCSFSAIPTFFLNFYLFLLLEAMTYNQVQLFEINDYANNYVDIEIVGYRALYSKSIAGRGITRLISWLGTLQHSRAS